MTNPIDVVKTRLMTDVNSYYKNTFDCFQKIAFEEGYSSFLKAIHIRTLSIASTGVLFFVIYESL
jgi:hypothetical protein